MNVSAEQIVAVISLLAALVLAIRAYQSRRR